MRNKILLLINLFLVADINITAQVTSNFTDTRNRQVYKKVLIGKQTWMAENLNASTFRNGDVIPQAKDQNEWNQAGIDEKPAWCYYNNDSLLSKKYGRLYNWFAVADPRGLAPQGFHVPTRQEWHLLDMKLTTVPFVTIAGENNAGEKMKTKTGWNNSGNGTNSSGFTAIPCGARSTDGFENLGESSCWWGASQSGYANDDEQRVDYKGDGAFIFHTATNLYLTSMPKEFGFSIRCIKD